MKKQEDSYRRFIFELIANEWNELDNDDSNSFSFIHQLKRVSSGGRNYTRDEVNDHVGTMLVAVSQSALKRFFPTLHQPLTNP